MHARRMPWTWSRDRGDTSTGQGTPKIAANHQMLGAAWREPALTDTLVSDIPPPDSETISVLFLDRLLWCSQDSNTGSPLEKSPGASAPAAVPWETPGSEHRPMQVHRRASQCPSGSREPATSSIPGAGRWEPRSCTAMGTRSGSPACGVRVVSGRCKCHPTHGCRKGQQSRPRQDALSSETSRSEDDAIWLTDAHVCAGRHPGEGPCACLPCGTVTAVTAVCWAEAL